MQKKHDRVIASFKVKVCGFQSGSHDQTASCGASTHTHTHTHTRTHTLTHTQTHTHTQRHKHTHTHTQTDRQTESHAHTLSHTHTHTHTHTHNAVGVVPTEGTGSVRFPNPSTRRQGQGSYAVQKWFLGTQTFPDLWSRKELCD